MQTKQIGIILLIGLLTLGVIGSSIPYTESQFFLQNTDINYLSYTQGDYNNSIFLIDKNIITTIPFSDINNASIIQVIDTNAQTACGTGEYLSGDGTCSSGAGLGFDTNFETAGLTLTGSNTGDQDLSGLVPYVGATSNVDLGANNLTTNYLDIGANTGDWVRMAKIGSGSATNGEGGYIEFPSSTRDGYGAQIGGIRNSDGAGKGDLIIKTGGNSQVERFRVTNNGNVGIGTTTPDEKLDVNGNAVIRGDLNVTGNINVGGCINYIGGTLGVCT